MTNQQCVDLRWQIFNNENPAFCVAYHLRVSASSLLIQIVTEDQLQKPDYQQAKDFCDRLNAMSIDDLVVELQASNIRKEEAIEAKHPFNLPIAMAAEEAFEFWSRAEYWSLGEAAALINGRNPQFVTEDYIRTVKPTTKIARQLIDTRQLLERARGALKLHNSNSPKSLINWLELKQIQMPQRLKELSLERSGSAFTLSAEIKTLKEKLAAHKTDNAQPESTDCSTKPEKLLRVRERDSLLKLILGMAIKGYSYDPKATRSQQVKEITDDLVASQLPLDEDTVRKYLNEAKALFSEELNRTE